jgi:hypothetical protein
MRFFGIRREIVRKIFLIIISIIIIIISSCPVILFAQARGKIVKIVTLIEDTKLNEPKDLVAAHGLSLYIERNGQRILFDTGPSSQFIRNSENWPSTLRNRYRHHFTRIRIIWWFSFFLWVVKKRNVYEQKCIKNEI